MPISKCILLFLLIFKIYFTHAQEGGQLEMGKALYNLEIKDTLPLESLFLKAKKIENVSLDSAYLIYEKILKSSISLSYPKGTSMALAKMGNVHKLKGEYDLSITLLKRAADTALKYNENIFLVTVYSLMAGVYGQKGSYGISVIYQYKALNQMKKYKIKNSLSEVEIYTNLGYNWLYLNEPKLGTSYLDSAEQILEKVKNSSSPLAKTIAIGGPYIAIAKGKANIEAGKTIEAKHFFSKALELAKQQNDDRMTLYSMVYLGFAYINLGEREQGLSYLNEAISIRDQNIDFKNIILPELYLAFAYHESEEYGIAKAYLLNLLPIAKDNSIKMMALSELAEIYAAEKNYKYAYETQNRYFELQDSLLNFEKGQAVDVLMAYQASEKDKEISQKQLTILQQKNEIKQKNLWIGIILASSLFLIMLVLSWLRSYRLKQKMRLMVIEKEQKIDRLIALMQGEEKERKRIAQELHDGIGSLISSAKMHLRGKNDRHPEQNGFESGMLLLDEAYHELRLTAHNLIAEQLLEQGLVHAVESYCKRISKPGEFLAICLHFGKSLSLPQEQELTIYRMLQELVQNAIKHGKATEVVIHMNNYDQLSISVEDNGSGMPEEDAQDKGSGLFHMKQRLFLWKGEIEIDSRPGLGVTVYINFHHSKQDHLLQEK